MARIHKSLVQVCINPKTKTCIYVEADQLVIGIDEKGEDIKVSDLLTFSFALKEEIDALKMKQQEQALKFNALQAAYKANTAKVAMQILENKENN